MSEVIITTHNGVTFNKKGFDKSFLAIPKCASTSIRNQFNLSIRKRIELVDESITIFSVIREPIERYISGYIEAMGRYRMAAKLDKKIILTLDKIFKSNVNEVEKFKQFTSVIMKRGFCEPHIVKQIDYLRDLNTREMFSRVKLFKLESRTELSQFLGKPLANKNLCDRGRLKKDLIGVLEKNSELRAVIERLYEEDLELYHSL